MSMPWTKHHTELPEAVVSEHTSEFVLAQSKYK